MKKKIILLSLILTIAQSVAFAETDQQSSVLPSFPDIDNKVVSALTFESLTKALDNVKLNSENYLDGIQKATDRYTQTNVVASYKDFSNIINSIGEKNDFLYLTIAQRLDGMGFFTLSQNALINVDDVELWKKSISELKQLYKPAVTLTYDEEIHLAQLQTATLYNNSAKETIKELEKNDKLLKKSDYANYVLAVAYYENNNYVKSLNAINRAINKAPYCYNYLHFKSKIYSKAGNYKSALKILKGLEKSNLISNYYSEYLYNDKLYILMKTSKKDKEKYYSAKLLFRMGDYQKALKEAQSAVSMNKKNIEAYILIGDCYIKNNEPEKAKENYMKAYEINQKYAPALMGLGHYYFAQKDYNTAYEYYLKASKYFSQNDKVYICLASCLLAKNDKVHAAEYLKKAVKINQNSDVAYYLLSKTTPNLQEQYLRTAISLNPTNEYAWLDLTELKITQKSYTEAKEYLFPVQFINPENPRYIYLKNYINSQGKTGLKAYNTVDSLIKLIF